MTPHDAIQNLMEPVLAGNTDATQKVNSVMAEITKEQFEHLFLPARCMKGEGDAKGEPTATFTTTVQMRPTESDLLDPPEVMVEMKFNQAVQELLLPAERSVWDKLTRHSCEDVKTPEALTAFVQQQKSPPRYLVVSNYFVKNVFANADWHDAYAPVEKEVLFTEGRFGRVLDQMDVYTDIFRYDTLRVLDDDEVYYVGTEPERQVRWTWDTQQLDDQAVELELMLHIT
ncbi:hypothetical protein LCGC14_0850460 [marine sediment metagenome]|uniref:Uncharacterized protein n=1 Tax=marine sediment metagenome TaxID=412755 RepID=A0A0F9SHI9_9ZZZZ